MAHKDLKKQLEGIFADLESPLKPINILALTGSGDEEKQEDEYQPENPLSGPNESSQAPAPTIPTTVVEVEPQQLQYLAETPSAYEEEPGILFSEPKDAFHPPAPAIPTAPVEIEPISIALQPQPKEVQKVEPTLSMVIEGQVQPKTESKLVTTEEVQEVESTPPPVIEDDVVRLLKSTKTSERRKAAQNLAQMHNEWTIDPLLYAATDNDQEVVRLALAGLLEMSPAVKKRVLSLPQEYLTPLHLGGTAFISCLVGQPFVYIAPGPFLMGGDPTEDEPDDSNELPQHKLSLPGYWIARYPVTASHFHTFLDESGYRPSQDDRVYGQDDYAVVDVTWNDALAYCRWLAQRIGLKVNLPSEAEWEKAARGTDGRRYPWGNNPPTAALYNPDKLTPVGQYSPQGDSPYGCADMAGNVWEWTRTIYESYPYNPKDGRENLEGDKARVICGLAFNNPEKFARCTSRYRLKPILHLRTLGFRVVISPTRDFTP